MTTADEIFEVLCDKIMEETNEIWQLWVLSKLGATRTISRHSWRLEHIPCTRYQITLEYSVRLVVHNDVSDIDFDLERNNYDFSPWPAIPVLL